MPGVSGLRVCDVLSPASVVALRVTREQQECGALRPVLSMTVTAIRIRGYCRADHGAAITARLADAHS